MGKPKIRFKGFTEEWEQRKLGEILYSLRNNTLSRAELSLENGVVKNVHYGDILVKFGEILDVKKELLPMIVDELVLAKYRDSFLQNGDIVIADTAEDETVGKCSEIAGVSDEKIIAGLHTIPCRPLFNFASGYLGYYLNSDDYHRQLLPLMQGIKVTSISKSALQDTKIQYPKSLEEQEQIGTYLRWLGHLITLHQRKCDETKKLKKYMLQKMFPQNGMKVPEIRFEGFTSDWEQRKLSELVLLITKGTTPLDKSGNGEINFIKIENIDPSSGEITPEMKISRKEHNGYLKRSQLQENDILFSIAGTLGRVSIVKSCVLPANTNQALAIIRTKEGDLRYLTTVLKGNAVADFIRKNPTVGAQPNLSLEQVGNIELPYPSMAEQEKIGEYFFSLDNLITLHQRKCDELVKIKKYMLQNMFV